MTAISTDLLTINSMQAVPGDASWYTIDSFSLAGRSLAEVDVWKRTGATVAAVRHNGTTMAFPDPDLVLCEQDQVYVVGTAQQLSAFEQWLQLARVRIPTYE